MNITGSGFSDVDQEISEVLMISHLMFVLINYTLLSVVIIFFHLNNDDD